MSSIPKEIKDKELYLSYKTFLGDALEHLQKYEKNYENTKNAIDKISPFLKKKAQVPIRFKKEVVVSNGRISTYAIPMPNAHPLLMSNQKEIIKLPGVVSCINKRAKGKSEGFRFNVVLWLFTFLEDYIDNIESLKFDEKAFNQQYLKFEEEYYSDPYAMKAIIPLEGFSSDTQETIEITDKIKIKDITPKEKEELIRHYDFSYFPIHPLDLRWVLEIKYERPKEGAMNAGLSKDTVEKIISGMRIFKKGSVGMNIIFQESEFADSNYSASMTHFPKSFLGTKYHLTGEEVGSFIKFMKNFMSLNIDGKLSRAIDRFNYGCEREKIEDKFIDFVVALEILYSKGREPTSLFSLRASRLLEEKFHRRRNIYKDIKRLFKERGHILHDGKTLSDKKLFDLCDNTLRKSLKKFIELVENKTDINEYLDYLTFGVEKQN